MNRIHHAWIGLAVLGAVGAGGSAIAATSPPDTSIKTSVTVTEADPVIGAFVKERCAQLMSTDPAAMSAARDALIGAANITSALSPSPAYLDALAFDLNRELLAGPLKNPELRIRLNAGIVAARIAEKADNQQLQPAALALLADKQAAVVLWGVKTTAGIIPAELRNPLRGSSPSVVMPAVIEAVKAHPSGPIYEEAFEAFTLDVFGNGSGNFALAGNVIDSMSDLLEMRVKEYIKAIPDDPGAESRGTQFLTDQRVWGIEKDSQKVHTVQLLSDLISLVGNRFAAGSPSDREMLLRVVQQTASAIYLVGDYIKSPALETAVTPLARATITMPASEVTQDISAILPAIISMPAYKGIKAPPASMATSAITSGSTDANSSVPADGHVPTALLTGSK